MWNSICRDKANYLDDDDGIKNVPLIISVLKVRLYAKPVKCCKLFKLSPLEPVLL